MAATEGWAKRSRGLLGRLDALLNRVYGSKANPLYHSGSLSIALALVLLATGLYLLLFYRLGAPYESVERIAEQAWGGRWIRTLHRYAADAMVVSIAFHALRMLLQRRSWGPRTLAWVSGVALVGLVMVIGWTGFVMVWDVQAQLLAVEGARFIDLLPIFSEPIGRTFVGERLLPSAFFFLNLFLHIALPIGMGVLVWVHVSRVARPALMPPRPLLWGAVVALTLVSVARPVALGEAADVLRQVERTPLDLFYAFWLPLTRGVPAWTVWLTGGVVTGVAVLAPLWTRPRAAARPAPSVVNERLCTGCTQCWQDCPFEAIRMVPRTDGREGIVARVDPALCVSCGICAGSCAPMVVGPPGRSGRDQVREARSFAERRVARGDVVIVGCVRSGSGSAAVFRGAPVFGMECTGAMHSSVVETLLRNGAGGVLVVACPGGDCEGREGPKWAAARLFDGREAELQERVDRRRVGFVEAGEMEGSVVAAALAELRSSVAAVAAAETDGGIDLLAAARKGTIGDAVA